MVIPVALGFSDIDRVKRIKVFPNTTPLHPYDTPLPRIATTLCLYPAECPVHERLLHLAPREPWLDHVDNNLLTT